MGYLGFFCYVSPRTGTFGELWDYLTNLKFRKLGCFCTPRIGAFGNFLDYFVNVQNFQICQARIFSYFSIIWYIWQFLGLFWKFAKLEFFYISQRIDTLEGVKTVLQRRSKSCFRVIKALLVGPDSRLIRIFPHAFDLRIVSFVCDAKPAFYSVVRIGLRMISACDVGRYVAKLTRALERNYSQLNGRFRIWCLKYKSREIYKSEGYEKKV